MDSINKIKNKIFFPCLLIVLLFLGFTGFVFAQNNNIVGQDRPLETDYLEIEGVRPETVGFGVIEYFIYVFNFIIILSGIFALVGLIKGGINYVTSSGDPGKIKKARDQIIATFVGIIILLGSYIMLYNISPQLVILDLITPERVAYEPEYGPSSEVTEDTPFGRIAEIAALLITESEKIKNLTEVLDELVARCSCSNVWSSCLCREGYYGECIGQYCWIGEDSHPCPEWRSIELIQRQLLASRDTIEYYKERLEAELKDLSFEVEQIEEAVFYYEERIRVEHEILDELDGENQIAIINQERLIASLENTLLFLNRELFILKMAELYTEELIALIPQLADEITRLAEFDETLGYSLIDSCWQNVIDGFCDPECSGGCHNDICTPERCSGGNPCAALNTGTIRSLADEIIEKSLDILELWELSRPDPYSPPSYVGDINPYPYQPGEIIDFEGVLNVPYYTQRDPRWANNEYGAGKCPGGGTNTTMGAAGCMPTAGAMVLSYYGQDYGIGMDPWEAAIFASNNCFRTCRQGTYHTFYPAVASYFSQQHPEISLRHKKITPGSGSAQAIINELNQGRPVIVVCNTAVCRPSQNGNHAVVIVGVQEGQYIIWDPEQRQQPGWGPVRVVPVQDIHHSNHTANIHVIY